MNRSQPLSIFESLVFVKDEIREAIFIYVVSQNSYYVRIDGTDIVYVMKHIGKRWLAYDKQTSDPIPQLEQIIIRECQS